jgi:cytochrome c553
MPMCFRDRFPRSPFVAAAVAIALPVMLAAALAIAAGDRELGQYLSSECVACHQLSGRAQGIPAIVGKPEATFVQALNEYRAKTRTNPVMQNIAVKLSDEEIAALAAYFGSLRPQPQ